MKKEKKIVHQRANMPYKIIIESEQAEMYNFCSKTDRSAICCRNETTHAVRVKIVKLTSS